MKSKEEKRMEAAIRKERYDSLSIEKKIELAKSKRGNSRKELAKLEKKMKT